MPTVGQELMPPMDTGAIAIKITTDANLPITKTQEVMEQINKLMYDHEREKLLRVSGSIGSEAGVMSIGSGSGIDHILIMATYVNRHEREETIWDISNYLRAEIAKIPHVKYLDVAPSGSTAMASNNLNEVEYPSHSFTRFFIGNDRFLQD
jgi:multidrug efflux pump subunit AcrB